MNEEIKIKARRASDELTRAILSPTPVRGKSVSWIPLTEADWELAKQSILADLVSKRD